MLSSLNLTLAQYKFILWLRLNAWHNTSIERTCPGELQYNMKNIKFLAALLLCFLSNFAAADAPFKISSDGQEVTDTRTRLVWRRCVEGMTASKSGCSGTAAEFTFDEALARATAQSANGVAWRVPTLNELCYIANRRYQLPAIDPVAFPKTPENLWSSKPHARYATYAWFISFAYGAVLNSFRDSTYHVRLVRYESVLDILRSSSTPNTTLQAGDDCPKI
jgi:hypothetical protein